MLPWGYFQEKIPRQFIVFLSYPLPTQPFSYPHSLTQWIFCSSPTQISILIYLCSSTPGSLKDRWAQTNLSPCLGSSLILMVHVPRFLSPFTGCVMTLVWFIYLFEPQFLIRIIIPVCQRLLVTYPISLFPLVWE